MREKDRQREIERERERERERESYSKRGNTWKCYPQMICHTGVSGMRVRFLRRWTKNTVSS